MAVLKKQKKKQGEEQAEFLNDNHVASAGDMTGMVPTPPQNKAQADSYAQLGSFPTPKTGRKKG